MTLKNDTVWTPGHSRVTVVVPTYNRSRLLRETIASVLAQPDDFILVISDNTSTDDTPAVVGEFATDTRVRYVRRPENIGLVEHFNWCLEQVQTEYVHVVPDDDIVYPEFLSITMPVLDAHQNAGLVHSGFDVIDSEGIVQQWGINLVSDHDIVERGGEFIRQQMGTLWRIHSTTALMRTHALRQAGLFHLSDSPGYDFALWFRLALDWDIAYVARPLIRYRVHSESYSATLGQLVDGRYIADFAHPTQMLDIKLQFLDRHAARIADREQLRRIACRSRRLNLIEKISDLTYPDRPVPRTLSLLAGAAQVDLRVLLERKAWRLIIVALMGPTVVSGLKYIRSRQRTPLCGRAQTG